MKHSLETVYGLKAYDLLEAIDQRFRLKVALEGAVAEVHVHKMIDSLYTRGLVQEFEEFDKDGQPDFSVKLKSKKKPLLIECKNVRNGNEVKRNGIIVAYKVETQKPEHQMVTKVAVSMKKGILIYLLYV